MYASVRPSDEVKVPLTIRVLSEHVEEATDVVRRDVHRLESCCRHMTRASTTSLRLQLAVDGRVTTAESALARDHGALDECLLESFAEMWFTSGEPDRATLEVEVRTQPPARRPE